MNQCFSFRQPTQDPPHHHRLMYMHSTPNSYKRMRTIPTQYESQSKACEVFKNTLQRQKSCRDKKFETAPIRSGTPHRQIKYFKLDLSEIINSSQIAQTSYNNHTQYQQKTPSLRHSVLDRFNKIDKQTIDKKNAETDKCTKNLKQNSAASEEILKILNSNQAHLHDIFSEGKLKQNIKANCCHKSKNLEGKYNRLRNHYGYPKMIKPSQFLKKQLKKSQGRSQLELKRLQKILIDKAGHQFRITIQKIN